MKEHSLQSKKIYPNCSSVRLVRQSARNSPLKKVVFKSLLEDWKISSKTVLTESQQTKPKVTQEIDSRTNEHLENYEKNWT